ncbi:MAG: redox-regulated ATPase YchF [Candidatus Jordarchaeum sp.]|uniref:redox-regulated ATPase YchF n=1 Tax=Candidatus Jordarchaeum sp. TaxID=2823881 RepID=UPI004049D9AA
MLVGIVGKPNSGKTTFLNAACLTEYKVAEYPFTTIDAQQGTGYVRIDCICKELGVEDNPKNSICVDGVRYIPVNLLDVAGLVPDAWQGRGLGNQFLDDLRRADALIHVVDASGSTDLEGKPIEPGTGNPEEDVEFLEREIAMWFKQIIMREWAKLTREVEVAKGKFDELLIDRLSGLAIKRTDIKKALQNSKLNPDKPKSWSEDDLYNFAQELQKAAKPMLICANKIDRKTSAQNLEKLNKKGNVVPASALAEYMLRKLAKEGVIEYRAGDPEFKVLNPEKIPYKQKEVLDRIREEILNKYGYTGVQESLNQTVFGVLNMIAVYPVEDVNKYSDHHGNVLPDVYLVPKGTTARELAYAIHTDLGDTFINAINAKTGKTLSGNAELKDKDIIRIVAAKGER